MRIFTHACELSRDPFTKDRCVLKPAKIEVDPHTVRRHGAASGRVAGMAVATIRAGEHRARDVEQGLNDRPVLRARARVPRSRDRYQEHTVPANWASCYTGVIVLEESPNLTERGEALDLDTRLRFGADDAEKKESQEEKFRHASWWA